MQPGLAALRSRAYRQRSKIGALFATLSIAATALVPTSGAATALPPTTYAAEQLPWLPGGVIAPTPPQRPRRPDMRGPDGPAGRVTDAATTAETLDYLNVLRMLNGLPALSENASWSDGAVNHSQYVVLRHAGRDR